MVVTLFDQREAVLGGALYAKNAPFDISHNLVAAISEKTTRKKVTAPLLHEQKS